MRTQNSFKNAAGNILDKAVRKGVDFCRAMEALLSVLDKQEENTSPCSFASTPGHQISVLSDHGWSIVQVELSGLEAK
jgi:hypothetical protein